MRFIHHVLFFSVIGLSLMVVTGCSLLSTTNERAVDVEDIIKMAEADIDSTVIIRQIEVTDSRFSLDTDEIIRLKKAGVGDTIIRAMIDSGSATVPFGWEQSYYPYDCPLPFYDYSFSYHYPLTPGGYPSYPGFYTYRELPFYIDPYSKVPHSKSVYIGLGNYFQYVPPDPDYRYDEFPRRVFPWDWNPSQRDK